jgi:hypothetical protein
MQLTIQHQEKYSRGQLLLRTLFGWLYLYIPHFIVLGFLSAAGSILGVLAWGSILIDGRYPQILFDYQRGVIGWNVRVIARMLNLVDGYPVFALHTVRPQVFVDIPYTKSLNRWKLLLKTFFGWFYVLIPHGIVLFFLYILVALAAVYAWFSILITAKYPKKIHDFTTGVIRWSLRVHIYFFMTDEYPPFRLGE